MDSSGQIKKFFTSPVFGVVGASKDQHKFGNKILRCCLQNRLPAIPVNPSEQAIEEIECVASVSDLPGEVTSLSIITPPQVTEQIVRQAVEKGIENIWMQPGAESTDAVSFCQEKGINLIYGGTCLLVVLGFLDH